MPKFQVQLETLLETSTIVEKIANHVQEDLSETMKTEKYETVEKRQRIDGVLDQYLADNKQKQDTKTLQVNLEEEREKRYRRKEKFIKFHISSSFEIRKLM